MTQDANSQPPAGGGTSKKEPPTAASLADLIDALGRNESAVKGLVQEVGTLIKDVGTRRASMGRLTSWLLFLFLVILVIGSGALVYIGRMSDGSFTFLLGVIVGSFIQFVDRFNLGGGSE